MSQFEMIMNVLYVVTMEEGRSAFKILTSNPTRKIPLRRLILECILKK